MGPSVVKKVVDSRYWYNTDAMVPDFDLGIGDSMGSATDGKIGIGDPMGSGTDGKIDIESVSVLVPDFNLGIGFGIGIGWKQPILPRTLADFSQFGGQFGADASV